MLPRPSAADRWVPCAGSVLLEELIPEDRGEDAKKGGAAHWAAAQVLGEHFTLEELTDRQAPNGTIISGEMVEHVQFYIDTINDVAGGPVVVEKSLPIAPGVQDGTPDALRINQLNANIWDFKYGHSIIEAVNNWQLGAYAVGLFIKHEWKLQTVAVHIVQPRAWHWRGRVRTWVITNAAAIQLYHMYERAAAATQAPDAVTQTGTHCRYCRAIGVCEAANRATLNSIDVAMVGTRQELTGEDIGRELTTLRRGYEMIKARLDAAEGTAKSILGNGGMVPGWSLQRSQARRMFKDGDVQILEALTGQTLTETKALSPSKVEKILGGKAGKKLVAQFAYTPETGQKLVPVDVGEVAATVFK